MNSNYPLISKAMKADYFVSGSVDITDDWNKMTRQEQQEAIDAGLHIETDRMGKRVLGCRSQKSKEDELRRRVMSKRMLVKEDFFGKSIQFCLLNDYWISVIKDYPLNSCGLKEVRVLTKDGRDFHGVVFGNTLESFFPLSVDDIKSIYKSSGHIGIVCSMKEGKLLNTDTYNILDSVGDHKFSKGIEDEIEFLIDNYGPPSEVNDFSEYTRKDAIYDLMQDCDDPALIAYEYRSELHSYGIELGVWREITQEEMDNTTIHTSSGRRAKKYDFKKNGKFYVFNSWDPLLESKENNHDLAIKLIEGEPVYSKFPVAKGFYLVAREVPYNSLTVDDKASADAMFPATALVNASMEDYVYLCNTNGGVIGRKFNLQGE